MPYPVGPDTFTAADGTELHAYNAGWTQQRTDVAEVMSNVAQLRGGGSEGAYKWDGDTFTADQYVQAKVATASNYGGVTVRATGLSNATYCGYVALYDGGVIDLQRIDNGVRSNLQAGIGSISAGQTLKLQIVGTTLKVFVNGSQIGTDQTDATYATGQPGMYWLGGAAMAMDDWTADTIPSGAGSSATAEMPRGGHRPYPFSPGSQPQRF